MSVGTLTITLTSVFRQEDAFHLVLLAAAAEIGTIGPPSSTEVSRPGDRMNSKVQCWEDRVGKVRLDMEAADGRDVGSQLAWPQMFWLRVQPPTRWDHPLPGLIPCPASLLTATSLYTSVPEGLGAFLEIDVSLDWLGPWRVSFIWQLKKCWDLTLH